MNYVACHACALSSVYLLFIFVQFEFCLFVLNKMFTIKDTKLLAGRGLRDASDVLHPCKKQRIKPWRPMLYWTGAGEYVYPFNVNLCCFELFTSGLKTARNILPWLWLISKTISFFQVKYWWAFTREIDLDVSERKNILCSLQKSKSIHASRGSLQNYITMLSMTSKQCFSRLVNFSTERTGDDLARSNHVLVNSRKWYLSFDSWISIKVSFTFQLRFSQTALL